MFYSHKEYTTSELYSRSTKIETEQEAKAYLNNLVQYFVQRFNMPLDEALLKVRQNIGCFSGYYDRETRARVEKLFNCVHPVLGSVNNDLSPEEIFNIGLKMGEKYKYEQGNLENCP